MFFSTSKRRKKTQPNLLLEYIGLLQYKCMEYLITLKESKLCLLYVYVCIFTGHPSVAASLERDSINWTKERGLLEESYFPNYTNKPGCHVANFALRHLDWDEKPWRGIPGPFQALLQLILPGIKLATPTSQVGEIADPFSEGLSYYKLWVYFFGR